MPENRNAETTARQTLTRAEWLRRSAAGARGTMRNVTSAGAFIGEPSDGFVLLPPDTALLYADLLDAVDAIEDLHAYEVDQKYWTGVTKASLDRLRAAKKALDG